MIMTVFVPLQKRRCLITVLEEGEGGGKLENFDFGDLWI
jgi:hypothetical protein